MTVPLRMLARVVIASAAIPLLAAGCSVTPADEADDAYGTMESELTSSKTVGNWSKFPNGQQCLVAVQLFYPAKFGVHLPLAGDHWTGSCAPHGACHIWYDQIPSSSQWERIPNDGKHLPSTYDVIVYPPHGSNPWGHIASVDHVEGKTIYVIDDNYVGHLQKASKPHTVSVNALGWYHLKKLPKNSPTSDDECVAGGHYCGGDKIGGNPNTLYRCNDNGSITAIQSCSRGCAVRPGRDDACRKCVVGGYYCGGDKLPGDPDTLYECNEEGLGDVVKHCSKGCAIHSGSDDSCK